MMLNFLFVNIFQNKIKIEFIIELFYKGLHISHLGFQTFNTYQLVDNKILLNHELAIFTLPIY